MSSHVAHVQHHPSAAHHTPSHNTVLFLVAGRIVSVWGNKFFLFSKECFRFCVISLFAIVPYIFAALREVDMVNKVGSIGFRCMIILGVGLYLTVMPWYLVVPLLFVAESRAYVVLSLYTVFSFFWVFLI